MITIILAGGEGKRMKSNLPKVVHPVNDTPMIVRVINNAKALGSDYIIVVVNPIRKKLISETVEKFMDDDIIYVAQNKPQGTGHALKCCVPALEHIAKYEKHDVLILCGDTPLLTTEMLTGFIKSTVHSKIIGTTKKDPTGYGRVLTNKDGNLISIKEHKDCQPEELKINTVNAGIYMLGINDIIDNIDKIDNNNAQNEYYITDLMNIVSPFVYLLPESKSQDLMGVNDQAALKVADTIARAREMKIVQKKLLK